jgi:sugar lactone lactonase YvrE
MDTRGSISSSRRSVHHFFSLFALLLFLSASGVAANLTSVTLKPTTVVQGTPSVGTVTLDAPAPAGGVVVILNSLDPAAVVSGGVGIPEGGTSAEFVVDTAAVTTSTKAVIQSSCSGSCSGTQTATLTVTPRLPVRGVAGDLWADVIIGKPDFGEDTVNQVTHARLFNPGGVTVDRSVRPNRVYAYDGSNSRVLGSRHLGICGAGSNAGQSCTANSDCVGSTCAIQEGIGADLVLGQPDFTSSACNGDSSYQHFPTRAPASATTLCSEPESQISVAEGFSFANMAVDSAGNLYVPDFDNNRVVRYNSPFTTDTIADYVWGQADFTGNACNRGRGIGSPDGQSLCFRSPLNEGFTGGVDIDSTGNLWASDNANHRVLRFPKDPASGVPAQVADLVLGQPDFTSASPGVGMNQMCAPAAVRVDAAGTVYVADSQLFCNLGSNGRILIFHPPLSSGMSAGGTLGSGLLNPTGLELDPGGGIWVTDTGNNQFLLFAGGIVQKVLGKDVPNYTGSCTNNPTTDGPQFCYSDGVCEDSSRVCGPNGSIGIDTDGNVFLSAWEELQDVWRFPAPIPAPTPGIAHSADKRIYEPAQYAMRNYVGPAGFDGPRGVAVAGNQLIVADPGRLLFWNNASSLTNGQAADGYVGVPSFFVQAGPDLYGRIAADGASHLWLLISPDFVIGQILVYSLPLTTGASPILTLNSPLPVLGGGTVSWDWAIYIGGLAPNSAGTKLWVADPIRNRVFRVSNPLSNPVVDIVLGQTSLSGTLCNQGNPVPSQTSLCDPGSVALDPQGNVYISDASLEVQGNFRLLEYDASLFPNQSATALFGIPASRVFGRGGSFLDPNCQFLSILYDFFFNHDGLCAPLQPAFASDGQMVVGTIGYVGNRFPSVYKTPLASQEVDTFLNDFSSYGGYSAVFDSNDDLYIGDLDRGRVLVYRKPLTPPDTTPPVITVSANPATLWPPNSRLVSVTVTGQITDPDSGVNPASAHFGVTDEYGEIQPSGGLTLDSSGKYSFAVQLQASRHGDDPNGRQYRIAVSAEDMAGNKASASAVVVCPHDQRK